jgi:integrase
LNAAMRDSVSVRPVKHPRYKFVVAFRERQADGSTARRKNYYPTKKAADAFAVEQRGKLANHGAKHSHVADDERAALIRFRIWSEAQKGTVSLLDLINEAILARETSAFTITVKEMIQARELQAQRKGSAPRHLSDLESRLNRFGLAFGKRVAAEVKTAEIEQWLHGLDLSAVSFGNYKRAIGSAFALAVKQGKLALNPVQRVDAPKVVQGAPSILTPSQVHSLLAAAAPEIRPMLVLQAFAGVRRAEAERLTWEHIHLGASPCVELPSEITKTNRRRSVELFPNAVAWLKPLVGTTTAPLGLTPTVYCRRLKAAAKVAGIEWDENLLRHSFGSYRLAQIKNVAQVAEEMGNSPQVVRTHYQNLVRPEAVADYWKVTPCHITTKVLAFKPKTESKAS